MRRQQVHIHTVLFSMYLDDFDRLFNRTLLLHDGVIIELFVSSKLRLLLMLLSIPFEIFLVASTVKHNLYFIYVLAVASLWQVIPQPFDLRRRRYAST